MVVIRFGEEMRGDSWIMMLMVVEKMVEAEKIDGGGDCCFVVKEVVGDLEIEVVEMEREGGEGGRERGTSCCRGRGGASSGV